MSTDSAELSSISSALEAIADRITAIAERRDADPDDPISTELFEVERSVRNAVRTLERARTRTDR